MWNIVEIASWNGKREKSKEERRGRRGREGRKKGRKEGRKRKETEHATVGMWAC